MSTYADKVNSLVAQVDENGNLPEGMEIDEGLQFAVNSELRRRNTQSTYTQSQQRIKALEAENAALAANWEQDAVANLSATDKAELDELKVQDPDAWRAKIGELEQANKEKFQEKRETISKEASQLTELEQRKADLAAFNEANPNFVITDDVIANDIPPRITNKLKNGEITFIEFLETAKKYVETPKVIQKTKVEEEPDFANARGSRTPSKEAEQAQSSNSYKKEIY